MNEARVRIERVMGLSRFYKNSILGFTLTLSFILIISFFVLTLFEADRSTKHLRDVLMENRKRELEGHVLRTFNFIEYMKKLNPAVSEKELQDSVIYRLKSVSFGDNGYIFVFRKDGFLLLTSARTRHIGKNLFETNDTDAIRVVEESLKVITDPNGGFIDYLWDKPGQEGMVERKISYVKLLPEWDWIIGAGSYLDDIEKLYQTEVSKKIMVLFQQLLIFVVLLLILSLVTALVIKHHSKRIIQDTSVFTEYLRTNREYRHPINPDSFRFREFRSIAVHLRTMVRKQTAIEQKLSEREKEYREIVSNANSAIIKMDMEGRVTFFNECAESIFGYSQKEIQNQSLYDTICFPSQESLIKDLLNNTEKYSQYENLNRNKEGNTLWISWTNRSIYNEEGEKKGVLAIANDRSESRKNQEIIEQSLKEKEVLLREIHHRVKNNLQIIISLLNLNTENIKDPQDLDILRESENRIRSMAILHEQLYGSENIAEISMAPYITNLVEFLAETFGDTSPMVRLDLNIKNLFFELDTALPCGLIINELVTNSLKYAFPDSFDSREKVIGISISKNKSGISLKVYDTGVGIPEGFEIETAPSIGLKLVLALIDQLKGTWSLNHSKGTEWKFRFPLPQK